MIRIATLSLLFCLSLSLLWWSGAKNEQVIFTVIEKERIWQSQNLGFDFVNTMDQGLITLINALMTSPIPRGQESTLPYSSSASDEVLKAAVDRVTQKPYWQAMFALILLALGRLLVTCHLGLYFLPLVIPVVIDALSVREVQHVQFKLPNSHQFRLASASLLVLLELLIVISMVPVWITPNALLPVFLLIGLALHQMCKHYFK